MKDTDLIAHIRAGDTEAFNQLYRRHCESLWRFLFHFERNESEARDLFQDVWLRVTELLMKETEVENFRAWLFQVAANRYRDHLRRKRVRRLFGFALNSSFVESGTEQLSHSLISSDDPDGFEPSERLSRAVRRLPERKRQVFLLKEWEGFSLAEVAGILQIPVGTVKSRLHHAIMFLRNELKDLRD